MRCPIGGFIEGALGFARPGVGGRRFPASVPRTHGGIKRLGVGGSRRGARAVKVVKVKAAGGLRSLVVERRRLRGNRWRRRRWRSSLGAGSGEKQRRREEGEKGTEAADAWGQVGSGTGGKER